VLLGDGKGGFRPPTDVGDNPGYVAVADVNRDGNPDLVVPTSTGLGILLGKGDGTFETVNTVLPLPGAGFPLLVGDFNQDGNPDVAISIIGTTSGVTVALGDGKGNFTVSDFLQAGPGVMVSGDFNGDHLPDIAVLEGSFLGGGSGTVSAWLGDGHGAFQKGVPATVDSQSSWMAAGDFNGDGVTDLVVADPDPNSNSADVLIGDGQGGFGLPVPYPAGPTPVCVVVADFNGDDILDVALTNATAFSASHPYSDQVSVLLGDGQGHFGSPLSFGTGPDPLVMATADMNRDGSPDLVVVNSGRFAIAAGVGPESVSVLLNRSP
jgi:hypothetical protein